MVFTKIEENKRRKTAKRILKRNHLREAYVTSPHLEKDEAAEFVAMRDALNREFPRLKITEDKALNHPHRFKQVDFLVKTRAGDFVPITQRSDIIRNLRTINQIRLYVEEKDQQQVGTFCNDFIARFKKERAAREEASHEA